MTVLEQINATLRSRKFWALVSSLVLIWSEYFATQTPEALARAVNLSVAALSGYALGVAIEGRQPGPSPFLPADHAPYLPDTDTPR